MGIFFGWIIFSFIVGALGSGRNIGFWGAFFLSLILSPVIGLIITLFSKDKEDEKYKQEVLITQKQQQETLTKIQDNAKTTSIADDLNKLKEMKDNGLLNDEEFQKAKEKILSK
jgi:hypothetical protein